MQICDSLLCCGCGECAFVCPHSAVIMERDRNGFLRPAILSDKCVECGLCQKKCPVNVKNHNPSKKAYAAYSKNKEIRERSSSGGIFAHLAMKVISDGGVVYGAGFGEGMKVVHKSANSREALFELMGSKYVQSDISHVYEEIEQNLSDNKKILFCGTPCQTAAIRSTFGDNENIILCDFVCHGVPSPLVWEKFISEKHSCASGAAFRDKKRGWEEFSLRVDGDRYVYNESRYKDPYLRMFIKNVMLRDSCYNCNWKEGRYTSDISIGDFWGITKVMPKMNDDKGTSVIIVRTDKGVKLLESIKCELVICETSCDKALKSNGMYRISAKKPEQREAFFEKLSAGASFDDLANEYGKPETGGAIIKIRLKNKAKRLIGRLSSLVRK